MRQPPLILEAACTLTRATPIEIMPCFLNILPQLAALFRRKTPMSLSVHLAAYLTAAFITGLVTLPFLRLTLLLLPFLLGTSGSGKA